jgi:predicted glycosyltransferase
MSGTTPEPRLLIYSQDGLGLGHLRRTTLLAAEFLAARPNGSVLTICDSPIGQFFSATPGHDYLKLPSIRKLSPGHWAPVSLSSPFVDVLALRTQTIRTAALSFDPDVMLVDHMPHGAMGELVPTLEALESTRARMVLGLRDILDAPATVRRRWRLEGAFEAVERHFDDVLVYGSRDVFDVGAQYAWPSQIRDRLRYCGYVCSPTAVPAAERVRRRYLGEAPNRRLVVAMAGGGADGYPLFDTLIRAVPALTAECPCTVVVVTGPFLPEAERVRLQRLAEGLPVHLVETVSDSLSYLSAADLVVGMAGYNTTAEILSLGTRAVLVPRAGPSAEQQMRARSFAERGWVRWLPPAAVSAESLATAMLASLDTPSTPQRAQPDLRGRQRAAHHLLNGSSREQVDDAGPNLVMSAVAEHPGDAAKRLLGEG